MRAKVCYIKNLKRALVAIVMQTSNLVLKKTCIENYLHKTEEVLL